MRIAQIVCTFPPYAGGIGNSAHNIGELLTPKHEVNTFFPQYRKKEEKKNTDKQKLIPLRPCLKYGNGAVLIQLIWKLQKFDCLYLHYPFFGTSEIIWLLKSTMLRQKKLVIHYHMDTLGLSRTAKILSFPSKLVSKSLFKKADAIIVSSIDYIKNGQMKNFYQKNSSKFFEVPFGVDTEEFSPSRSSQNSRTSILFVGGLDTAHYFKGVDKLLEAAAHLEENDWHINIVGEGDLKPFYQRKTKKLGLEEKVSFLGKLDRKKLIQIYRESEIFVLPSTDSSEAFGIVLIEAMACGLPVVASDLPGVRKVFENQKEGYLAKTGEVESLANKIGLLLRDPARREKMGVAARKKAEAEYSLSTMRQRLNQILEK